MGYVNTKQLTIFQCLDNATKAYGDRLVETGDKWLASAEGMIGGLDGATKRAANDQIFGIKNTLRPEIVRAIQQDEAKAKLQKRLKIMDSQEYQSAVNAQNALNQTRETNRKKLAVAGQVVYGKLDVGAIEAGEAIRGLAGEITKNLPPARTEALMSYLRENLEAGLGEKGFVGAREFSLPLGGSWANYKQLAGELSEAYGSKKTEALIRELRRELDIEKQRIGYLRFGGSENGD